MLCNRTAKLQHRMGEICHFEMLREFLPTAFSSCEAIIFLNYNMIYKSLLSFILLMRNRLEMKCIFSEYKILPGVDQMRNKKKTSPTTFSNVLSLLAYLWVNVGLRVLNSARLSLTPTLSSWVTPATLKALTLILPQ